MPGVHCLPVARRIQGTTILSLGAFDNAPRVMTGSAPAFSALTGSTLLRQPPRPVGAGLQGRRRACNVCTWGKRT
jgi:hypothetical protein